ncbi:hypothetical protein BDR26DRAFT_883545 [Obelidium mucronatum]|nr:hypothetical protein BDR26DRAFT_883545 [Obelidium mucronatum]
MALLATTLANKPIELLMQELVFDKIGASRVSGFSSLGREDSSMGLTTTANDLSRLLACLLDGTWGPVTGDLLQNMLTPAAAGDDANNDYLFSDAVSIESTLSNDCSDFKILNCGWIQSRYRGLLRIGFDGASSSCSFLLRFFPDQDFGYVVVCDLPCFLPIALGNVVADFMLEIKPGPGPWVPRFSDIPFPYNPNNNHNDTTITIAADCNTSPPPRSPQYYVGTYSFPNCPFLAFKVTQSNGTLNIRFLNGQLESLQPNCNLLYSDKLGFFYFSTKSFLPKHLSVSKYSKQFCGILFENGLDGSVSSLIFFNNVSDTSNKSSGILFAKSVAYQSPSGENASAWSSARNSSVSPIPPSSFRSSTASNNLPPSLPPRRTPDPLSRQQSFVPNSNNNNSNPLTASLQPPALPPRSRASSAASVTVPALNTATTATVTPQTAPTVVSPPPTYSGPPPPLIPLDKSRDQDFQSVRDANHSRISSVSANAGASSSSTAVVSPPPQYSTVATLDKLLVRAPDGRATAGSSTRDNNDEDDASDGDDDDLHASLEEISKDMDAVDDLFKELGMD